MAKNKYKIRYGNVWLLTDDRRTSIDYVDDRALASIHTLEWATTFRDDMRNEGMNVEIFSLETIKTMTMIQREESLKRAWLNRLENLVLITYNHDYSSGAFWTNAHMLHGKGIPVEEAVALIGDANHLRLTKKSLGLTLDDGIVLDQEGVYMGEFDGTIFVPSSLLLDMEYYMHHLVQDAAYNLPGAPVRPTGR